MMPLCASGTCLARTEAKRRNGLENAEVRKGIGILFMSDTIHLYVNMSGNTILGTSFATIGEALASLPDVPASESGKQFPAPVS